MSKRFLFFGIFLFVLLQNIYASEQFPDILVYKEKECAIGTYPMESYFAVHPTSLLPVYPENSALKRGYRAKYEIVNNELILIDLEIMRDNGKWRSVFKRYFGNKTPVKVDTFTGKINIFNGKETGVYMAFTPIHESYIIINIDAGNYIDEYNQSGAEFLQSVIRSCQAGSYEHEYFSNLLEELSKSDE